MIINFQKNHKDSETPNISNKEKNKWRVVSKWLIVAALVCGSVAWIFSRFSSDVNSIPVESEEFPEINTFLGETDL